MVLGLTFLLLGAAGLILAKPGIIINDRNLQRVADLARKKEWADVKWTEGTVHVKSTALFANQIAFSFRDLSVKQTDELDVFFKTADFSLATGIYRFIPRVREIGPVEMKAGRILWVSHDSSTGAPGKKSENNKKEEGRTQKKETPSGGFKIPFWLADASVRPMEVSVYTWKVQQKRESYQGRADVKVGLRDKDTELDAHIEARREENGRNLGQIRGGINFSTPGNVKAQLTFTDVQIDSHKTVGGNLNLILEGGIKKATIRSHFHSGLRENHRASGLVDGQVVFQVSDPLEFQKIQWSGSGDLQSPGWRIQPGESLSGKLGFSGEGNSKSAQLKASIATQMTTPGRGKPKRVEGTLNAELNNPKALSDAHADFNLVGTNLGPALAKVEVKSCNFGMKSKSAQAGGDLTVDCPVVLTFPSNLRLRAHVNESDPTQIHLALQTQLHAKAWPPSVTTPVQGKAELNLKPFQFPFLSGKGDFKANIDGIPSEYPKGLKVDSDLNFDLAVSHFEGLVKRLVHTPWPVPAPFHVMKGNIAFNVHGKSDASQGQFPLSLTTRLHSEHQSFDLDGKGALTLAKLRPAPEAHLDFKLLLSRVMLELPRLDLGAPPPMVPDARFVRPRKPKPEKASQPALAFTYDVQVKTPADQPLRLLSNLVRTAVPIQLDLALSSENAPQGSVQVRNFPVQFFRRDATFEHFNIALKQPTNESKIDGAIKVAYTDYTITILIMSTLGKPIVKLVSDPPLPEDKLMATLLFGRPMEELDSDQAQSVGNSRAAIADGALGLASMYALASTPVESVDYNPKTKLVTAKVKLAEGTSLNVGSNGATLGEVGIRKRLTSKIAITTEVTRNADNQSNAISAFLEWASRY
jgi:hypothetical protein